MNYNPIKLNGNWTEGYALDKHTLNSHCTGYNMWGYPVFDTTYSEVGECVNKLKYRGDFSQIKTLADISTDFLNTWNVVDEIDLIIPAPPSKKRDIQPVFLLVEDIAKNLKKHYCLDYFQKLNNTEVKNLTPEEKAKASEIHLKKNKTLPRKANILLVDDLYDSGFTLNIMCKELLKEEHIGNIYVLTMTKTRKG